jgi:hypothetical protein
MKKLVSLTVLLMSTSLIAAPYIPLEQQVGSITVSEKTLKNVKAGNQVQDEDEDESRAPFTNNGGFPPSTDTLDRTGKVISVAKDMVALGEAIYQLVKKGKPTNTTTFAAISVVPKDPSTKEYVDPFDLENFSIPVEREFSAIIKNGLGREVVRFDYTVVYSYGGTYNQTGKYLTNVMIVPKYVKTSFGWDFNATMSLSGIMNHGSKIDPVAGAMVTMKYQMNSWTASFERNDTIHITGNGQLKSFGIK